MSWGTAAAEPRHTAPRVRADRPRVRRRFDLAPPTPNLPVGRYRRVALLPGETEHVASSDDVFDTQRLAPEKGSRSSDRPRAPTPSGSTTSMASLTPVHQLAGSRTRKRNPSQLTSPTRHDPRRAAGALQRTKPVAHRLAVLDCWCGDDGLRCIHDDRRSISSPACPPHRGVGRHAVTRSPVGSHCLGAFASSPASRGQSVDAASAQTDGSCFT